MLKNILLILIAFSFILTIIPTINHEGTASAQDWPNFWQRLKGHTQLVLDYTTDGQTWIDISSQAHITYTDRENPNVKKFGLDFTAPVTAKYRLRVVVKYPVSHNCTLNRDLHIISIYYENYTIRLNYSDIAPVGTINIAYEDDYYFGFKITSKNNIPAGYNVNLDPEYLAYQATPALGNMPYDSLHWQNSRRIARISNGTYFLAFCNGTFPTDSITLMRSFDDGVTWHWWRTWSAPTAYCPSLIPDSHDNLHIAAQTNTVYIEYQCYNTTNNSWGHIQFWSSGDNYYQPNLDIDKNNKLWLAWYTGKYVAVCVNSTDLGATWSGLKQISQENNFTTSGYKQSQGMFAFLSNGDGVYAWTGRHVGSGGFYCVRMRKYFVSNSTWSTKTINVSQPLGYSTDQFFPSVISDDSDNIHIAWFDFSNSILYYRKFLNANKSFSGVNRVGLGYCAHFGSFPSLSIDATGTIYVLAQTNRSLAGGFGTGYYSSYNASYWKATYPALAWTYVKISQWNGSGARFFKDPVSFYSRFPISIGGGYPNNRPVQGVAFCYMNFIYKKNWDLLGQQDYSTEAKILVRFENVTWTLGCPGFSVKPQIVNTTRATLRGRIGSNITYTTSSAGFYVKYGSPPTQASYDFNFTAGSGYNNGKPNVYCNATGFSQSKYYYVRAWFNDGTFWVANTTYMLMKPANATSLQVKGITGTAAWLKWANPTITNGSLHAVCRWSTTGYPGTMFSGSAGFNVTTTSGAYGQGNVTGLSIGSHIYFSIFEYMYAAGSPLLHSYSSSYSGIIGNTTGGHYLIYFTYENDSAFFNPHNLFTRSHAKNSTLIVYYSNKTEYNVFNYTYHTGGLSHYGVIYHESSGYFEHTSGGNTSVGYVMLNLSYTPIMFEFRYNITNDGYGVAPVAQQEFSCIRRLIPLSGQKNFTFYIPAYKKVYGFSTAEFYNNSIIPYTMAVSDFSGLFLSNPELATYITIYCYNRTGDTQIIDQEYVDSYNRVYPWLLHDKQYFWSIGNANYIVSQISVVPTFDTSTLETLVVRFSPITYTIKFNVTTGRINPTHNGLWLRFQTSQPSIMSGVSVKFYDFLNGSLVYSSSSALSDVNFTYAGALANRSYYYVLLHNGTSIDYTFSVSWFIFNINQTKYWNGSKLENSIAKILGPYMYTNPNTGKSIGWLAGGVIFGVFLVLIFSGITTHSNILIGGSGLWFIFSGTMFISTLSIAIIPLGVFAIFLAFIWKKPKPEG